MRGNLGAPFSKFVKPIAGQRDSGNRHGSLEFLARESDNLHSSSTMCRRSYGAAFGRHSLFWHSIFRPGYKVFRRDRLATLD